MSDISDQDRAELLILYQVTIDDIERAKQWGWKVAYSTIAADGAILALFNTYKTPENICWTKILFIVIAIALMLFGVTYIKHAEAGLKEFRARIITVRERLGSVFKTSFGKATEKKQWPLEVVVIISTLIVISLMIFA